MKQERLISEFLNMAKISSPSKEEKAFAEHVKSTLEEIGLEVNIDDAGKCIDGNTGNVIGRLKGSDDHIPLIFSAHMDTVQPCENIAPVIDGNKIISEGETVLGSDDKAGIAAIVEALRTIKENNLPHGDIEVVFTICEETGMHGAKNFDVKNLNGEICYIFDCEGKPGTIIKQGPAKDIIKAVFKGKKAHAGVAPEEGVSAIQIAAHAVSKMKLLRIDEDTTANIGTFHGATATNVVCDEVSIVAEARSLYNEKLNDQTRHMIDCMENAAQKFGGKVEVEVIRSYDAFNLNEEDKGIALVKRALSNIGLTSKVVTTGGGSDANVLNGKGLIAVDLGIGMTNIHTTQEYIEIKDLVDTTKIILELTKLAKK